MIDEAAGTDSVAVANADCAVGIGDRDDWCLLRDETLDRVGTPDLRWDVDQPQFDSLDARHANPTMIGQIDSPIPHAAPNSIVNTDR